MSAGKLLQEEDQEGMGPVGPWAVGRVSKRKDDGPLTGLQPVVGAFSSTMIDPAEWGHTHRQLLIESFASRQIFQNVEAEARMASSQMLTDLQTLDQHATSVLRERAASVRNRIDALVLIERQMASEVRLLWPFPTRLRRVQDAMALHHAIAAECLALRARRPDAELKADHVEKLLMEEASAAHEGRCLAARSATAIEEQIATCRDVLSRLHEDWSLKTLALIAERSAIAHGNEVTPLILPAAMATTDTMGPTPQEWEKRARLLLQSSEEERERSLRLRARVDYLVRDAGRDVAKRRMLVDEALNRNIDSVVAKVADLEAELFQVLERQVRAEALCQELEKASWRTVPPLKSAQSRLVERRARPPTERTPDEPQMVLLDEAATALAMDTGIRDRRDNAQRCLKDLQDKRSFLEGALHLKKWALFLDRDRVRKIRGRLPARTSLQGMDLY